MPISHSGAGRRLDVSRDGLLAVRREVKRQTDLLEEIHRHVTALAPGAGQITTQTRDN